MSPRVRLLTVMLLLLAVAGVCAAHQGNDSALAAFGAAQAAAVIAWSLSLTAYAIDTRLTGRVRRFAHALSLLFLRSANQPGMVALLC